MTFVRTTDGAILNGSLVREARCNKDETMTLVLTDNSERTARCSDWHSALDLAAMKFFPAAPGTYALQYGWNAAQADFWVGREVVVGWGVDPNGHAHPVSSMGVLSKYDDYTPVLHPDGRVQDIDGTHDDEECWLAHMRVAAKIEGSVN